MFRDGRFNRYTAPVVASLAVAIGAAACGSESLQTSPATDSRVYPANPNASGSDPANWHEVVVVEPQIPEGAEDVIVGFENPGADEWKESKPIEPDKAHHVMLRIGPAPVEFRVQLEGKKGSAIVQKKPHVKFVGPETERRARAQGVAVPPGWEADYIPSQ